MLQRHVIRAAAALAVWAAATHGFTAGVTIDHRHTDLRAIPLVAVEKAKAELHVAYGHTSHGSQVTEGMTDLNGFINGGGLRLFYPANTFYWTGQPTIGALDLDDYFVPGDLGAPDRETWATRTGEYLDNAANADVNVVMWSWCGQADTTAANIDVYLNLMNTIEAKYPDVTFVYMTGHTNGCATTGQLFLRNQQIRDFCAAQGKVLYDFADIESWDPDGNYYGDKRVNDNCDYDSDGNGSLDRNWATDWANAHVEGVDWYTCSCAHSQSLNGNRKAYAAWALWTTIASLRNPVPGDANHDGLVTEADAAVLAAHWLTSTDAAWEDGDFNQDGAVNDLDASILAAHWQYGASGAAVPEPSVVGLFLVGLTTALLLKRWSRRQ